MEASSRVGRMAGMRPGGCSNVEAQYVPEGFGYLLLLGGTNSGEKREGEGPPGDGFSERKRGSGGAGVGLPGGLKVDGSEVAAGGDPMLCERGADAVSVG